LVEETDAGVEMGLVGDVEGVPGEDAVSQDETLEPRDYSAVDGFGAGGCCNSNDSPRRYPMTRPTPMDSIHPNCRLQ
jgi:hypothetical protein